MGSAGRPVPARYVLRRYPDRSAEVVSLLQGLELPSRDPNLPERVYAAVLAWADGDVDRLLSAAVAAESDWRDVLMTVPEFANEGWDHQLDRMFGPDAQNAES